MKISLLGSAVVLALCVAGCEHNCFEIEIRPDGQAFQRRLSGWHEGGKEPQQRLPAADLARLAKLYAKRESAENAVKQVFSGRFTDNTPEDLGGAGVYTHFTSPLGTTTSYIERFRGNDDLESDLAKRRQGADQLTGLVLGWLTAELGHDPNFPRLKNFLDEDLREDLKNLGVYAWTSSEAGQGQLQPMTEFLARVSLYLCQRGYFSPQQIPKLFRAFDQHDPAPLLAHIQRFVARKMGVPDTAPIPPSLAFLGDPQRLAASLTNYVRSSDLFRERVVAWKAAKHDKADAKEPSPNEFLDALAAQTVLGNSELRLMHSEDTLDLKVVCGQKPYATNGAWDEATGTAKWSQTMAPNRTLPVVCFALWSTPNREFQDQHFGQILLADEELALYTVWYRSLKPEEADQWDRFLAGLRPGGGLAAAIKAFRFADDPKPDPNRPKKMPGSLAETPRGLLLQKLASPVKKAS